ncbi:MAG: hypothetical protein ACJ757_14385 [Gaiellaceae bacterium]
MVAVEREITVGVWGDVPTWIGAVGTLLAFGIALLIYAQSQREQRRAQARRVSGWVPGGVSLIRAGTPLKLPIGRVEFDLVQVKLMIRNDSQELVSDLEATIVAADGGDLGVASLAWIDVGPGQHIELDQTMPDTGKVRDPVRLKISFVDATGRRWERLGGNLRRVRDWETPGSAGSPSNAADTSGVRP